MLKTLLPSVLLAVSMTTAAKSQDHGPARPTSVTIGGPWSIGLASPPDPRDEIASRTADAALRFATRREDTDDDSAGLCAGRRWKCVLMSALVGLSAGTLLGSALGTEPEYQAESTFFGTFDKCVAHCEDKQKNAQRFGLAGLVVGFSASFALTR